MVLGTRRAGQRKLCPGRLVLLTAASGAVALSLSLAIPGPAYGPADTGEAAAGFSKATALAVLDKAMVQVHAMEAQVKAGSVVPKFGERAAALIEEAASAAPEVAQAVQGALEPVFLQQLALLRRQLLDAATPGDADAVAKSEDDFLQQASDLSGSVEAWSTELERELLRAGVEHKVETSAALAEEKARAAIAQRSTIEVIGKLQEQMEQLAAKAQSARGGNSPWVLSTSYRIPNTPLQFVSRYEQGRANIELNLTPDKDPSKGEGGFASSIGPANVGVSFDIGI